MKPNKIIISYPNGKTWTTEDSEEIRRIGLTLPSHIKWVVSSEIETLSNLYFRLLTELAKNTETGNTKTELHNALKPMLLNKFKDIPQYFIDGKFVLSTRNLSYEGWLALIEELKVHANDIFGYVFK